MFDIDFSFDFTRRSPSPSKPDTSGSSTFQSPPSSLNSLSPPLSTSDSVSQDGHNGSPHWISPTFGSWNTKVASPDFALMDDVWSWAPVVSEHAQQPTIALDDQYPLAIDPAALNYYGGIASSILEQAQAAIPVVSIREYDHNQLIQHIPSSASQAPNFSSFIAGQADSQSQIAVVSVQRLPSNQDIALKAIAATGVATAIPSSDAGCALSLARTLAPDTPAPRLSKPDLAACPPLAKHLVPSRSGAPIPQEECPSGLALGATGRPKTSHTTIERRYRTNLNARILALRNAVPALRVLDKEHSQRPEFAMDVVDERGYVDGVKAARKASKASILGKAAEYIHVLKKREIRLKHEVDALRTLLGCLVGGEALLREFDADWQSRYGAEDADEVAVTSDGDDGDEDGSEEETNPRKKAKIVRENGLGSTSPTAGVTDAAKRKRGRPKKAATSTETSRASTQAAPSPPQQIIERATGGGAQYLLGVFLFFSLLKPSSEPAPAWRDEGLSEPAVAHHEHTGFVYGAENITQSSFQISEWSYLIHNTHTILSILLLLSLAISALKRRASPPMGAEHVPNDHLRRVWEGRLPRDLLAAEKDLRTVLHVRSFVGEIAMTLLRSKYGCSDNPQVSAGFWRLANSVLVRDAANDASTSWKTRTSIALALNRSLPPSALVASTVALLLFPVSKVLAEFFWSKASSMALEQGVEDAVMTVLRTPMEDVWSLYIRAAEQGLVSSSLRDAPVSHVCQIVVLDAVGNLAEGAFVREACKQHRGGVDEDFQVRAPDPDRISGRLMSLSRGVGGPACRLLEAWREIEDHTFTHLGDCESESPLMKHTWDVVNALGLLQLVSSPTSSQAVSLPPALLLRRVLASRAFSSSEALEEARDAVVDYLYEQ